MELLLPVVMTAAVLFAALKLLPVGVGVPKVGRTMSLLDALVVLPAAPLSPPTLLLDDLALLPMNLLG